ncbi:MAG TPA: adenylosuccinate lyase [Anaerolineae bacterium]|nr:adenylosuccinate lyase [Anaerolineae bacterium]
MSLHALSPLDGRYNKETSPLRDFFSEFAYLKTRTRLELDYLTALSKTGICAPPNISLDIFSDEDAFKIQEYEKTTRHDVKAIEYYLRDKLPKELHQWIHFGLTSEDINNIAQSIALKDSRDQVLLPALDSIITSLHDFAKRHRTVPLLARTHGQPAVPTTLGKEYAVYLARLMKCRDEITSHKFEAKLTGAVGNFNALYAAYPNVDWESFSKDYVEGFGLEPNLVTSQILPYDNWIRFFQAIQLTNSILIDFAQDMWRYISDGLLKQKVVEGEVGSSTMPQKVNPIHFENAEGNLGVANALFTHYAQKLPVSRLQRDLSDSTVRRTFGSAVGHTLLAWINVTRGMSRVDADEVKIKSELNAHWEVVSEGAQTILRAAGRSDAYESLRSQMKGVQLDSNSYRLWVEALDVDEMTREKLMSLSPEKYIGVAIQITDNVIAWSDTTKRSPINKGIASG